MPKSNKVRNVIVAIAIAVLLAVSACASYDGQWVCVNANNEVVGESNCDGSGVSGQHFLVLMPIGQSYKTGDKIKPPKGSTKIDATNTKARKNAGLSGKGAVKPGTSNNKGGGSSGKNKGGSGGRAGTGGGRGR